jgi:excisionase family DNA binding protein
MKDIEKIEKRLSSIENLLTTQKTVLNFEEVAAYTGLSKSYLYKMTSSGGIPCYKPNGKQVYFSKSEIDRWLLQNRKATSEEIIIEANNYVVAKKGGCK